MWSAVTIALTAIGIVVMVDMILRHVAPVRHGLEDAWPRWLRSRTGDADADREIARLERKQLRAIALGVVAWMIGMVVAATLDAWPVGIGAALVTVGALIAYIWRETQKNVVFFKTTRRRKRRRP